MATEFLLLWKPVQKKEHSCVISWIFCKFATMEERNDCALFNVVNDGVSLAGLPCEGHVHIVVLSGELTFYDGKHTRHAHADDLVIWQLSNTISHVTCSKDFDADILVVSPGFLQEFNPEMVWASKGFIFIKANPVFHLDSASKRLIAGDFDLFKTRIADEGTMFKREILGRIMQIFLFDLWSVYHHHMSTMEASDNASRIFLQFLAQVQQHCRGQRDVAFYASRLCISPKYLSQVSKSVSGLPASEWISFYSAYELVTLLNDKSKTLTEVADLMHFETLSHFSRYAKKLLGKSPTEYRKN